MLLILFIICLAFCAYPLLVYPLLVLLLSKLRRRPWTMADETLDVAFVITVYNESHRIRAKLLNTLHLTQLPQGMQIIVASDGSSDGTEAIVDEFADRGVRWIGFPRRGKEAAQCGVIAMTQADVFVFSDASTTLAPDSLRQLLRPFADASVGAVSGVDRVEKVHWACGESMLLHYEMAVRRAESLCGSLVGLSGCFFAVRSSVARQLLTEVPSDMGSALVCISSGLRAVSEDSAGCCYSSTAGAGRLFRRWRRTSLRGIRCLWAYRGALSWRRPLLSWQIVSHKWLRFLFPVFAVLALVFALLAALQRETWAEWIVGGALCAALLGVVSLRYPHWLLKPFRLIGFVVVMIVAGVSAWISLLHGQSSATWTPTAR